MVKKAHYSQKRAFLKITWNRSSPSKIKLEKWNLDQICRTIVTKKSWKSILEFFIFSEILPFSFQNGRFLSKNGKIPEKIKNSKIYFKHFLGTIVLHIWYKFHVFNLIFEGEDLFKWFWEKYVFLKYGLFDHFWPKFSKFQYSYT